MDFALKFDLPVWLSYGTLNELGHRKLLPKLHIIETDRGFSIADLEVHPFTVPHDAKEPLQFVFDDGQRRLGVLTDTGTVTPYIAAQLSCCHALMLECNHDPDMLRDGPYPDHLKKRVGGRFGHLSNQQAAELLRQIHHPGLQHVIAAHLSQKNNRPELAARALSEALAWSTDRIDIAGQVGLVWHRIN
jgi:phosphoribosyl 1,2-cyclic phosphodiesterase